MQKLRFLVLFLLAITLLYAQSENSEWQTEFEKSNYLDTEDYQTTMDYFQKLADYSEYARFVTFGKSPQNRALKYLIVSKDKAFNPAAARVTGKSIILVQNGIHSGEIEGKDASMLLLREILVSKEKASLLDNVILIVIPIFNVDGHERTSPYNRINQDGPASMGWRTTAQNLNLNRDYAKADTPEMKAFLKLYSAWLPDVFIDTHTTDGLDYQYTLTYSIETHQNARRIISNWALNKFTGYFVENLEKKGFYSAPYFGYKSRDPREGVYDWVAGPRFSNVYAAYQNRIGILFETHMLKPYKERVFCTKAALEVVLNYVNNNSNEIINLSNEADKEAIEDYFKNREAFPLDFDITDKSVKFNFRGYEPYTYKSKITGSEITTYSDKKFEKEVDYYNQTKVTNSIKVPKAYIVPSQWYKIIDVMKLHGISVDTLRAGENFIVDKYKFADFKFAKTPYEGHLRVTGNYNIIRDTVKSNKGDFYITCDQRAIPMIIELLEPKASDSFLQWGFFNVIFERKEYFEFYSMEPIAKKMIEENPELKKEFEEKLNNDPDFAKSPYARLNFFYERSKYFDKQYKLYPVMRVINAD